MRALTFRCNLAASNAGQVLIKLGVGSDGAAKPSAAAAAAGPAAAPKQDASADADGRGHADGAAAAVKVDKGAATAGALPKQETVSTAGKPSNAKPAAAPKAGTLSCAASVGFGKRRHTGVVLLV